MMMRGLALAIALIGCSGSAKNVDADGVGTLPVDGGDAARSSDGNAEVAPDGHPDCAANVFRLTVVGQGRVDTTGPIASTCEPTQNTQPTICTYEGCGNYTLTATWGAGWVLLGWEGDCTMNADGSATTTPGNKTNYACTAVFVTIDAGAAGG
jgi:hypothetical protein